MTQTQRIENDFYETHRAMTRELMKRAQNISGFIFEPTSGNNEITNVLHEYNGRVDDILTNDIDQKRPSMLHFDAAVPYSRFKNLFPHYDWAVGNPPFSLAHLILPNCLSHARVGVAFLLRLSYMEPTMKRNVRGDWLQQHADQLRHVIVFGDPRPKFRTDKKSGDNVTTAWFVWDKTFSWNELGFVCPFHFVTGWKR